MLVGLALSDQLLEAPQLPGRVQTLADEGPGDLTNVYVTPRVSRYPMGSDELAGALAGAYVPEPGQHLAVHIVDAHPRAEARAPPRW